MDTPNDSTPAPAVTGAPLKPSFLRRLGDGVRRNAIALSALFVAFGLNPAVADGFTSAVRYFANGILIADGTAAAPGLAFLNDQDTGIYRPNSLAIGFAADGAVGRGRHGGSPYGRGCR